MTKHDIEVMTIEGTIPSEQLVEGIALSTIVVLLNQTTRLSLVSMIHVHVAHTVPSLIVQTEINCKFHALQDASRSVICTQYETSTQTSNIAQILTGIINKTTQSVKVTDITITQTEFLVVTIVQLTVSVTIEQVVTLQILHIGREQRRNELCGIPYV